jgi:hypothetical protein
MLCPSGKVAETTHIKKFSVNRTAIMVKTANNMVVKLAVPCAFLRRMASVAGLGMVAMLKAMTHANANPVAI